AARRAADGRDRRFAEIPLGIVEPDVELLKEWPDLLAGLAEQEIEVEAGRETFCDGAREDDDAGLAIVGRASHGGNDGTDHGQAERIDRRTVERDARDFSRHLIRSEEHTSELQSHLNLVCRLL